MNAMSLQGRRSRYFFLAALALLIALACAPTQAQTEPTPVAADPETKWNCWISLEWRPAAIYLIRCILDREVPPSDPPPGSSAAALLDYVHDMINHGQTTQLDADLESGYLKEVVSFIPKIRIFQYPYEESWAAERPYLLVQGLLCPATGRCSVKIQR